MEKKTAVSIAFLLLLLGCTIRTEDMPTATLGNGTIKLELADTNYERNIGLSNRYTLAKDWGMLFVYDKEEEVRMHMKDMRFDLDIIWIDGEGKVTKIVVDAQKCMNDCVPYVGWGVYVLEVNAGVSVVNNVTKGAVIALNNLEKS